MRRFRNRTLVVAGVLLGVAAVVWLAWRLSNLIFMVFVALFITIAFEPAVHWLEKNGWKRGLAAGAVLLGAVLAIVGFLASLAPLLVAQGGEFVEALPGILESFAAWLNDTFGLSIEVDPEALAEDIAGSLEGLAGGLAGGVFAFLGSVGNFLLFVTTTALFTFFMLAEMDNMQRLILSFMPPDRQLKALHIWDVAVEKMGGYVYSRLFLAAIAAGVAWAALAMLGVPFAPSLGIWVGVLSQFVPVVGTYLAMILPMIVAITFNDLQTVIWILVIFTLYQQVENYLVGPWITRRTMEIHPAVTVGAILAGGYLLGGVGVILALPVAGIVQAIIGEYRRSHDVVLDDDDLMAARELEAQKAAEKAEEAAEKAGDAAERAQQAAEEAGSETE